MIRGGGNIGTGYNSLVKQLKNRGRAHGHLVARKACSKLKKEKEKTNFKNEEKKEKIKFEIKKKSQIAISLYAETS